MTARHDVPPPIYSRLALGAFVLLGIVLCYLITRPFVPAIIWSFTLAVLFIPVERALRLRLQAPALSVSLTLLLVAIAVVAPAWFVSIALIENVVEGAQVMRSFLSTENWPGLARDYPGISPILAWADNNIDLPRVVAAVTTRFETWGASLLRGSLNGAINLLLTFYFLFYFLRDHGRIKAAIAGLMPLSYPEFCRLADRMVQTVFATVYGTLAVSALQGFLGGLVLWWLDLPSPVFWGFIMGLLAIVPFLGAFVVWVPFAVILAFQGEWLSAIVLVAWGTLVVGLIDNIVYPILVGRQLAIHSMVSFIAIVGGIIVFGAHGFVLGPLIVAGSCLLLEAFKRRSILDAHSRRCADADLE